jgi:GH24 family phage-related lysozyme (muramidase)
MKQLTDEQISTEIKEARWCGLYSAWLSDLEKYYLTVPVTKEQIATFASAIYALGCRAGQESMREMASNRIVDWNDDGGWGEYWSDELKRLPIIEPEE